MAENNLFASISQLASIGTRLSVRLQLLIDTAVYGQQNLTEIAKEISFTSAVLAEVAERLSDDQHSKVASDDCLQVVREAMIECSYLFEEIDGTAKPLAHASSMRAAQKNLKHIPPRSQIDVVRSGLNKASSHLLLIIQVLDHATKMRQ